MRAGTAFARAASQPSVSGVGVLCIAADSSRRQPAIKQNLVLWKRQKLPVNASAGPGRPRSKIPLVGNFFARHGCGGLRAGLLGDVLIARNTARDQNSAGQKQNSINCKAFENGQRT